MTSLHTLSYAVPSSGYLWKWSGDFDAVEWHDGSTLALWPEVHTVLAYFECRGSLPPFGSLLFILAACREDWKQSLPVINRKIRGILSIEEHGPIPPDIAKVLVTGLEAIHTLPADLRSSIAAKCHLVSLLLEGGPHSISRDSSGYVLKDFSINGAKCLAGLSNERSEPKARLQRDLRALELGLNRHTPASLESLLRTGLETKDFQPAEIEEAAVEVTDPRLLLDTLIAAGGESGAAAMVAKRVIAMINFPGHVGTPRNLPVGGIADITNRGTIDRLLPGELAWDDLVLAARLVHNEALYFRREIPPMNVAIAHTVLLSRELRLWGIGRVLSLGIALGLWHHPALNGTGETFECIAATDGDEFEYLELDSPAKISATLETLVPSAGPVPFLKAWWEAAQIVDDPAVPDISFIAERSHLDDEDTCLLLGEMAGWIHGRGGYLRVIAVDSQGYLEVQSWTPGGNRSLVRGEIDVGEILKAQGGKKAASTEAPPAPAPLRATSDQNILLGISSIYADETLPFLFPEMPHPNAFLQDGGQDPDRGGVGVTHAKKLMQWPRLGFGGQLLCAGLPGRLQWVDRDETGAVIVITSADQPSGHVGVFRWRDHRLEEIPITGSLHSFPRRAKLVTQNALLLAYSDEVEVISLTTGQRIHTRKIESLPANPVFDLTSTGLQIYDGGPEQSSIFKQWTAIDRKWPRMIEPSHASILNGVLRIQCADKCFRFSAGDLRWHEEKPNRRYHFVALSAEYTFESRPEVNLRRARLGMFTDVWHDLRGFLHVKASQEGGETTWSIMLSATAASVWHSTWGLWSSDPLLQHPQSSPPVDSVRRELAEHLKALLLPNDP